MRAPKMLTPAQLDHIKYALACLLNRTQGALFTKDEQDGIVEAWEMVRNPATDTPLVPIVEDKTPDPEPPVKTLIQLVTGKWASQKNEAPRA